MRHRAVVRLDNHYVARLDRPQHLQKRHEVIVSRQTRRRLAQYRQRAPGHDLSRPQAPDLVRQHLFAQPHLIQNVADRTRIRYGRQPLAQGHGLREALAFRVSITFWNHASAFAISSR